MTCEELKKILHESDASHLEAYPPAARDHLRSCGPCRKYWRKLVHIEEAWRRLPVPVHSEAAKIAFLQKIQTSPASRPAAAPTSQPAAAPARRPWAVASLRWSIAASFFMAALLGAWLFRPLPNLDVQPEPATASLVERLVEWNVAMASAPEEQRARLAGEEANLKSLVDQAPLSQEERKLAFTLLANGAELAQTEDPLKAANLFDQVAEQLQQHMDTAINQGNANDAEKLAKSFDTVSDQGVKANLDRSQKKDLQKQQQTQVEQLANRNSGRSEAIHKKLENAHRHNGMASKKGPKGPKNMP